jgi:hypothetical protein
MAIGGHSIGHYFINDYPIGKYYFLLLIIILVVKLLMDIGGY